jgi:MoxR-like ATPase
VVDDRQVVDGHDLASTRARIAGHIVGRQRELELILAAVAAGRDLLLEGPPGTSKSTLLRAITAEWGIPFVFVEGNADLTPTRLIGHHNPARVLQEDYRPENFVDGPLLEAMREGGFLYIEEFNRAPEDTINSLLTSMAERQVTVPRVGTVTARPTFRVIASMNPYDNVGTTRLSTSVHDRLCRLAITYQDEQSEQGIVTLRTSRQPPGTGHGGRERADRPDPTDRPDRLIADAVAITRATRRHPDIRQGSSVRGAIDLTLVAEELLALRQGPSGTPATVVPGSADPGSADSGSADPGYAETVYDAMVVALSGRIQLDETVEASPEEVLRQLWEDHFVLSPAAAKPG